MQKKLFKLGILGLAGISMFSCQQEEASNPPNIIVFIADDVSWDDFGCYGNEVVQTPNIDRLSSEGIKFNNVYLTASSCSPSRVSILSGRYPHNTGAAELHTEPPLDLTGFADVLRENGYYCGQAGKWHAGEYLRSGFDTLHSQIKFNGGEGKWLELVENRPEDKPFFMWLASIDAHRDWGENEFSGTHDPADIRPPLYMSDDSVTRKDLAQYYDEITRFDHYIGEVEDVLREQGVLDNTYFIIMADNGRPFPGCKTRVYDRGMQTPFIIRLPGGAVTAGRESESLISAIDIAPTVLDIAGIQEIPEEFQGKSFAALFEDPSADFRNYVFAEHNWHDYEAHERMVRTKDFMYVLNFRPQFPNQGPADVVNGPSFEMLMTKKAEGLLSPAQKKIFSFPREPRELFDCNIDPMQLNNLIFHPDHQQKVRELHNVLMQWMGETGDNIPENLTPDWFERFTGDALPQEERIRGEMPGKETDAIHNNNTGPF